MKTCRICLSSLPLNSFNSRKDTKDKLRSECKKCQSRINQGLRKVALRENESSFWKVRATSINSPLSRRKGKAVQIILDSSKITPQQLQSLYQESPHCHYCFVRLERNDIVFDHKIPLSKNGTHSIDNLCIACCDCNRLKHDRTEDEFINFLQEYNSRLSRISQR